MAKAIKLQDDNYIDSSGVVHNRVPLNEILEDVYSTDEVKTNKIWVDENGIKHPIYRKTVLWKVGLGTKWINIKFSDIGITNYNHIYFAQGSYLLQNNRYIKELSGTWNIYLDLKENIIQTQEVNTDTRDYTIVLEYTK